MKFKERVLRWLGFGKMLDNLAKLEKDKAELELSNIQLKQESENSRWNDLAMGSRISMHDNYMFDFKNWASGQSFRGDDETETIKIPMKPIQVVQELESEPNPFTLQNLDEKIAVLNIKKDLITQDYSKREVVGLIERLENRKKYEENSEFFNQFKNTTDEKIDLLLNKYELVMKPSDIFVPEFPDEAVNVMKAYTDKMQELFEKKPIFYVIAEDSKFRKAYEKRDPILLVQSPFGFFWQILGAWDEEMLILSEL